MHKIDSWQVQVCANGEPILTIGDNFLSGKENVEDYASLIRNCAGHLTAFAGDWPICDACNLPITDEQKNVGHECDLHEECAKGD